MEVLIKLLEQKEPYNICMDCQIVKPKRSRHCEICQRCIAVYDHHCPWINNCVGKGNHRFFLFYILLTWLNLLFIIVAQSRYFAVKYDEQNIFDWFDSKHNIEFKLVRAIFQSICITLCAIFFFPLTILVWVQVNNFLFGRTTHERFAHNAAAENSEKESTSDSTHISVSQKNSVNKPPGATNYSRSVGNMCFFCYEKKPELELYLLADYQSQQGQSSSSPEKMNIQRSESSEEHVQTDTSQREQSLREQSQRE